MAKIFHITDEHEDKLATHDEFEYLLEKAFKEGCEHGYHKAMKEHESFNEKAGRINFKEDFKSKIEKLKEKYK